MEGHLTRKHWWILYTVWALLQVYYFIEWGVYKKEEAEVYINLAIQLTNGNFAHSIHYWLYAGYILPLTLLKLAGLSFNWMYLVNLALGALALGIFPALLTRLGLSKWSVFAGTLLLGTCHLFQRWTPYLFTDPFFGNLVVIVTYLILKFRNAGGKKFTILAALLVFASFVRPVGFLLFPVAIVHAIFSRIPLLRILLLTCLFVLIGAFVLYCLENGTGFFYPNHNLGLNIICGLESDLKRYEMVPFTNGMTIPGYFLQNPELAIRLFTGRLIKTLWMTRPYFDSIHNLYLTLFCISHYLLALAGLVYIFRKKMVETGLILTGCVVWLLPNMLLCADWHNRFMVPFIPFLLIMVTFGIEFVFKQIALLRRGI